MDTNALTQAIKFAVHHKDELKELTVHFSDHTTIVGYLSKVVPGEVLLTEGGAVPFSGHDHKLEPERVVSLQFGLADGSFHNFPGEASPGKS
jgi:hypothetical protein